ncbi:uncharacterized protein [Anoplolepis gracilipes]|uniref:uncharacterized protein n=1 Tax=Anoplolepis gracilipes TaxID=354296 RepID=UPI003BA1F6D5
MAAIISRLLVNLSGPDGRLCRVYASTVQSVLLYAAPVWAGEAMATRRIQDALRCGWPFASPAVIGREESIRSRPGSLAPGGSSKKGPSCNDEYPSLHERPPPSGARTVLAVLPCLEQWLDRAWGSNTFRMTQVFSGHGCFGEYLRRIGKEASEACHHCGNDRDTAQHTFQTCPAWSVERGALTSVIEGDLELSSIVRQMLDSEEKWRAIATFCGVVMAQKESTERERRPGRGRGRALAAGHQQQQLPPVLPRPPLPHQAVPLLSLLPLLAAVPSTPPPPR